jgi:ACR3 family arsenite efflux pump ArsB
VWKLEELRVIRSSLSVSTMISLFVLIFIIIFSKASLLIAKPTIALEIIGYQTLIVFGLIALSLAVDKILRIKYEDHQSIILTSITKNESVAVAMATMALSPAASVVPQ